MEDISGITKNPESNTTQGNSTSESMSYIVPTINRNHLLNLQTNDTPGSSFISL